MKKYLFLIITIITSLITLSCQQEDFGYSEQDIAYEQAFEKAFPNVDPNHTFCTSVLRTLDVDINIPGSYKIKVFTALPTDSDTDCVLLADYEGPYVGGTGETYSIDFDCPAYIDSVYAAIEFADDSDYAIYEKVMFEELDKARVLFGSQDETRSTRALTGIVTKAEDNLKVYTSTYGNFSGTNQDFQGIFANAAIQNSIGNFIFVSTGEQINISPVFLSKDLKLSTTNYKLDIFLNYRAKSSDVWSDVQLLSYDSNKKAPSKIIYNCGYTFDNNSKDICLDNKHGALWRFYPDNCPQDGICSENMNYAEFEKYGILLPAGYQFKFTFKYYKNSSSPTNDFDCENANNRYKLCPCVDVVAENNQTKSYQYIGLSVNNAKDYNDFVLAFTDNKPLVVTKSNGNYTLSEYTIAYEDKGTNDFDYNDVVLGVTHVNGQQQCAITLKAVGGTLPVYLEYDKYGTRQRPFGDTELHNKLTGNNYDESKTTYKTVNVSNIGDNLAHLDKPYQSAQITISNKSTIKDIVEKLSINVKDKAKGMSWSIGAEETSSIYKSYIVVSSPNFNWTAEGIRLQSVYVSFEDWLKDHTNSSYSEWWNNTTSQ